MIRILAASSSRENGHPTLSPGGYLAGTYATPNTGYFTGGFIW